MWRNREWRKTTQVMAQDYCRCSNREWCFDNRKDCWSCYEVWWAGYRRGHEAATAEIATQEAQRLAAVRHWCEQKQLQKKQEKQRMKQEAAEKQQMKQEAATQAAEAERLGSWVEAFQ